MLLTNAIAKVAKRSAAVKTQRATLSTVTVFDEAPLGLTKLYTHSFYFLPPSLSS